jgi:hypothetical protein
LDQNQVQQLVDLLELEVGSSSELVPEGGRTHSHFSGLGGESGRSNIGGERQAPEVDVVADGVHVIGRYHAPQDGGHRGSQQGAGNLTARAHERVGRPIRGLRPKRCDGDGQMRFG